MMKYKIFVDLDGVLSDFRKGLSLILQNPVLQIREDFPPDIWVAIVDDFIRDHRLFLDTL